MSRPKEHNEQEASKLDEYFKETLARVRPYIFELSSKECAQLCKLWLDKLSTASSQRRLRNEYLVELCRQLKTGRIDGIFGRPPPNGLLLPLPKSYHMVSISSSLSDLSDYATRPCQTWIKPSTKCAQREQRNKTLLKRRIMDSASTSQCSHAVNISPTVRFYDKDTMEQSRTKIYQNRIDTLNDVIAELQAQNEYLKDQLLEYQENVKNHDNNRLYSDISQLTDEVTSLKSKLVETQKMKDILEESHKEIVQEYYGTVVEQLTELKSQLYETQLKNEALSNNVSSIADKIEEIVRGKDEESKAVENQWMNKLRIMCQHYDDLIREKSTELEVKRESFERRNAELSRNDVERREEIELLANKIQNLESKLETKIKDEGKLQLMVIEQYATIKEEFSKIRSEIDQAGQRQNQDLISKVAALKKLVTRLEKSKERLEHEYEKKISCILKNKDMEIRALQLRLQGQKNELNTSLSSEKQNEVAHLVSSLEERYKTLLLEAEAAAESQNQEYLRKIAVLEEQMKKSTEKNQPY